MPRISTAEVLFVSHTAQEGGAELALRRYVESGPSIPVRIVTLEDGPIWSHLAANGAAVTVLGEEGDSQVTRLLALRRFLRSRPRSVVVGNSMRASFYCALVRPRSSRLVYWVRDGLTDSAMNAINIFLTRAVTIPRTRGCIANSRWTAETVHEVAPSMPVEIAYSPSGISIARDFTPRSALEADAPVKLLFLGRLAPWKGPHLAISALQKLLADAPGRYTLTLAGGPLFGEEAYFEQLRSQVADLGLEASVEFLGHVSDVASLFASHDALLHCSIVPEPFGQVVVQAMAAGLPVIAANTGGPLEVIHSGTDGLLYEMGDLDALVASIRSLVGGDDYAAISAAAELTARTYSDAECARQIERAVVSLGGLEFAPAAEPTPPAGSIE